MDQVEKAFDKIDRQNFVLKSYRGMAGIDSPLPIGYGQTISQPSTVKIMLEWLDAKPSEKVLDVGSGSGWTTALLSEIVGPGGEIFAVERILELVQFGKDNCEKIGIKNAKFFQSGNGYGLPQHAPYDRILVSASSKELPAELLEQLKIGGKLVVPVADDILEITKNSTEDIDTVVHPGFIFVPLIKY